MNKLYLESIYSDGSVFYVSNPEPEIDETVQVSLRVLKEAPVECVLLRSVHDGAEQIDKMELGREEGGFSYYTAPLTMTENKIEYRFMVVTKNCIYYYTQRGIQTYIPDETYNFKLLADYRKPTWVRDSVFYQIFPERFCNGNPDNDVKDNEYECHGFKTIQHKDFKEDAVPWSIGHCADFFGGDLEGVKEKIPYLKKLGITAIYLNPIFVAPSNHKYDCSDYFHVDEHFGGDKALAELSEALHKEGMKLMLDISINHTGVDNKWFVKGSEYYVWEPDGSYKGWAGVKSLPQLDYRSDKLRHVIYKDDDSVLKKWLKPPYNIDGWRFDVADVFARYGHVQLSHEVWKEIRKNIRDVNSDAYILAEDWSDCSPYLQGEEWDSPMNYAGCARPLRQFVGAGDLFNLRCEELNRVNYKMTAEDLAGRITAYLSKLPYVIWENQFNLIDSHDVSRLCHHNLNKEEIRGAYIMQFMLPGCPSIYYGDEAGIKGVVGEDYGARFTMPWHEDIEAKPEYSFYKTLIDLKKNMRALSDGGMKIMYAKDYVFSLARFTDKEAIVTCMSTSDKDEETALNLKAIGVKKLASEVFNRKIEARAEGDLTFVKLPAHETLVFTCEMV